MKPDCVIGIDCGAAGAIVAKTKQGLYVKKLPSNITEIIKIIEVYKKVYSNVVIYVEAVQMYQSDNKGKQFNIRKLLDNFKTVKNAIEVAEVRSCEVHPLTWQTTLNLKKKGEEKPDRKKRYKAIAQKLYPEIKVTMWNCDALLILKYGIIIENMTPKQSPF